MAAIASLRLYLVRHARSASALPGQTDFDRTLDDTGYADAEIVADRAADSGLIPDLILCSTATRCRQTAESFRRAMGEELAIQYVDTLYAGPLEVYRDLVTAYPDIASLMIIGHNPMIGELMQELVDEATRAEALSNGFPAGALAAIDMDVADTGLVAPSGRLAQWLVVP